MITFDDIVVVAKRKYRFSNISRKSYSLKDIPDHRLVGSCENKIHGFKYSIIRWDHYYNPETGDYDVVFEGSYRFFSITNNFENKNLKDMTWEKFEDYDMMYLTEECEYNI